MKRVKRFAKRSETRRIRRPEITFNNVKLLQFNVMNSSFSQLLSRICYLSETLTRVLLYVCSEIAQRVHCALVNCKNRYCCDFFFIIITHCTM